MSTEHIGMMELERYFAGELGGADAERVGLHVGSCAGCGAALARLEGERVRFLNAHPFEEFALSKKVVRNVGKVDININKINISDTIQDVNRINLRNALKFIKINIFDTIQGVNRKIYTNRAGVPAAYGVIFALAAALVFIPIALTTYPRKSLTDGASQESPAVGNIRYKGVQNLSFMLMRGGEVRQGSPADAYRAGDRLQVVYSHPKSHHAALFSVDNAGTLSFYTGNNNDSICSIQSGSGSGLAFPSSIVLDDSRGEELVVMLVSEKPVSAENISDIVKSLSSGKYDNLSRIEDGLRRSGFGRDVSVSSVRIKKE